MGGLKRYLPKSLFGRVLLMLLVPLLLAQAVSIYVFYDRHWLTVSRRLALGLGGEIAVIIEARERFGGPESRILQSQAISQLELVTTFEPDGVLLPSTAHKAPWLDQVERSLAERIRFPFALTATAAGDIQIQVQLPDGVLTAVTTDKRVFSSTIWLVIAWTGGLTVLFVVIVGLFLRGMVRPIKRLAEAADAFGAGRIDLRFRPSGAAEVRRAATAFIAMRDRIDRQLQQRNAMLAGVSSDLRAPLERMRRGLDRLGGEDLSELRRDVAEMGHMLDGYLAFIEGQGGEAAGVVDLCQIIDGVAADARRKGRVVATATDGPMQAEVRPAAIRRCLDNLVDNAMRHAGRIAISGRHEAGRLAIHVDDDGPGIPAGRREEAMRPFVRLEPSRNLATGGTGLGLAIARDIASGHGGELVLAESPLGGLRATLFLPPVEDVAPRRDLP